MEGVEIKDVAMYIERMAKTMTRTEKLFFMDQIDLHTYSTIIDFGGSDGTLIYEIQKQYPEIVDDVLFVVVDNSPQMTTRYPLKNYVRVNSIDELYMDFLKGEDVLLICNSVLHECSEKVVEDLFKFCKQCVRTLVMRDMNYESRVCSHPNPRTYEDFVGFAAYDEVISADSGMLARFSDHVSHSLAWDHDADEILTHFIMKYEYVPNWYGEVQENYFSGNIKKLADKLEEAGWFLLYKRSYALPYKMQQAKKRFKYDLPNTHLQVILEKSED